MDIRLLEVKESENLVVRGFIPATLRPRLEDLYVFGGFENDRIIAVVVLGDNLHDKFAASLKYVFVHPDYRGKGYATEIMAFCEEELTDIGIKSIDYECFVEPNDVPLRYGLLKTFKYKPVYIDRLVMKFHRGHFRGEKSDLLYANISKLKLTLTTIKDYSDRRLLSFLERKDETGIYLTKEEYVPEMCVFLLVNDRIEAALCLKYEDDSTIVADSYYVSDKIKNRDMILPFMMSYLVKSYNPEEIVFDDIYVVCKNDNRAEAIAKTFGDANMNLYKQRYYKLLGK